MDNKLSLESIAKVLQVAQKIKNVYESNIREDQNALVKPDSLSMLRGTMQIISEFVPETHGRSFNEAMNRSHHYSITYREIKKHIREMRTQKPDANNINNIIKTVKVVMPVMETQQKAYLEKMIKVVEALNS